MNGIDTKSKTAVKLDAFNGKNIVGQYAQEKVWICDKCGSNFGSSLQLWKRHMKDVHNIMISSLPLNGEEYSKF